MRSRANVWLKSYDVKQMSIISNNKDYERHWMMSDNGSERGHGMIGDMFLDSAPYYYNGRSIGSVGIDRITSSSIGREIVGKVG